MNTGDNAGQGYTPPPSGGQAQSQQPPQPTTPLPGYPPGTGQTYYDPNATARVEGGYGQQYGGQATYQQPSAQPIPPQQPYPAYDARAARQAQRDQRRAMRQNRVPVVGPLLLIAAGVVFLLNNMGILDWSVWDSLWRLWPLVLVIVGIDMLVGRRSPVLSLLLVIVVIAAGAFFLYSAGGSEGVGTREQLRLNVPLDGATSAAVHVQMGTGQLRVDSAEAGQTLATGTLDYYTAWGAPDPSVDNSDNAIDLTLKQPTHSGPFFFSGTNPAINWTLHLNPKTSMTLDINSGTGRTDLDLEQLHVTDLSLDTGTGATSVVFPAQAGDTKASVDGGVGSTDIAIPAGVEARIHIDSGLGKVTVDPRFAKSGDNQYESAGYSSGSAKNKLDLDINAGVGSVTVSSR